MSFSQGPTLATQPTAPTAPMPTTSISATLRTATSISTASVFSKVENALSVRLDQVDKLTGLANYKTWSLIVWQYMIATDTLGIINGTILKPAAGTADKQA